MKQAILLSLLYYALIGCMLGCAFGPGKDRIEAAKQSETTGNERPYVDTTIKYALAWGNRPEWDYALEESSLYTLPSDTKKPCKKLSVKDCAKQLLSVMALYESNFKPETSYKESFKDSKGNYVISRGLLQLSKESANQKAYGCSILNEQDLHKPWVNLSCASKILIFQAKKSGTLIDGNRGGCSAYWSVCRKSSNSYPKIMKYLEGL